MFGRHALVSLLVLAVVGCAGSGSTGADPATPRENKPQAATQIEVERQVITGGATSDLQAAFDRAKAEFDQDHFADAAKGFEAVYESDPDGPLALHALFNAATALDQLGQHKAALERYQQVSRRFPNSERARESTVRAMRLFTYLEQWSLAGASADQLLARKNELRPLEAIAAHSAKALALLEAGELERAELEIGRGRAVVDKSGYDRLSKLPQDLAQLYFALGELRRRRGRDILFVPRPKNFALALEQRCQFLLDAQSAYSDTMRAHDAHWSTMAGYRVGELYQHLHEDLMKVQPPEAANTEKRRQLFEGSMRLRYSVLLKKGLGMVEHTLAMAQRTGEASRWVTRAQEARDSMVRAIAAENAAIDRLPYTRAQLQEALDELAQQAAAAVP